jgi:hypothetical protein
MSELARRLYGRGIKYHYVKDGILITDRRSQLQRLLTIEGGIFKLRDRRGDIKKECYNIEDVIDYFEWYAWKKSTRKIDKAFELAHGVYASSKSSMKPIEHYRKECSDKATMRKQLIF